MSAAVITAIDTQSNDSTAAIRRYQDGYRVADAVVTFGQSVKLGGIFVGGVIFVAGLVEFISNQAEHHGFAAIFVSLIAFAVLLILISQILAMGLRGEGQLLKAALDSDVNSSPFLSNTQRARAMSLRERPPVPTLLPVWTE
jgi:divalent metal cation (Fe/Co/Zn/Cd) transporter